MICWPAELSPDRAGAPWCSALRIPHSALIHIDRFGKRLLRCGVCRRRCRTVHQRRPEERMWRDLSLRDRKTVLRLRRKSLCDSGIIQAWQSWSSRTNCHAQVPYLPKR